MRTSSADGGSWCSGEPARRPARKGARRRPAAAERGGTLTAVTVVSGSTGEGWRASVAPANVGRPEAVAAGGGAAVGEDDEQRRGPPGRRRGAMTPARRSGKSAAAAAR
ncbi:hypothetical protein Scep_030046 [Stephania cephalantha]|uniref:Uncharacterized protein n=1 Tax=Stephania cephalantha TaxID=152367 RepID=A0AAP0DYT9_9MAGN